MKECNNIIKIWNKNQKKEAMKIIIVIQFNIF